MRIGPSPTKQLRITHWDEQGTLLIDMDWDDWEELVKDAEHFRKHGQVRLGGSPRTSPQGHDRDGSSLWVPPQS